jgi:hypothetical protein
MMHPPRPDIISEEMSSYLDKQYETFDEAALEAEIAAAEQAVEECEEKRDRAARRLQEAQTSLEARQLLLRSFYAWSETHEESSANEPSDSASVVGSSTEVPVTANGHSPTSPRGLQALIFTQSGDREWTISDIANELDLGSGSHRAISISVSRMARDGLIVKRRHGVYTALPPTNLAGSNGHDPHPSSPQRPIPAERAP